MTADETDTTQAVLKPDETPSEAAAGAETEGTKEAAHDGSQSRRVYVGNLAWEVSWQDLKDLMKTTGHEVTRSDIMRTHDGRSKGCGIVEFATVEGAKQAVLTLNDTELKGRQIFVREDREERNSSGGRGASSSSASGQRFSSGEQAQSRRVYVGNLSWDVAWPDLKDHMRQAGEVVHAEVICEHNGRSKGCGIVEYATDEQAQKAIETLTHTELKGRTIFVREDRETSSGGVPQGSGTTAPRASPNTSVYVWNLTYETSWQDLKDHMRKAGNVDQATILSDADGNSMGCGIVSFQKPAEAARAIRELQDSELKGRQIRLREDRAQSGGRGGGGRGHHGGRGGRSHGGGRGQGQGSSPSGLQVFVGNLSYDTDWRGLKDHFKECGDVDRADVRRGFGTVRFHKKEDAQAAIQKFNGTELDGRTIEVRLDSRG